MINKGKTGRILSILPSLLAFSEPNYGYDYLMSPNKSATGRNLSQFGWENVLFAAWSLWKINDFPNTKLDTIFGQRLFHSDRLYHKLPQTK